MIIPSLDDNLCMDLDQLKQLFNDPSSAVGKYMYEQDPLINSAYPVGQSPYPVNRFLRDLIFNNSDFRRGIYGLSRCRKKSRKDATY